MDRRERTSALGRLLLVPAVGIAMLLAGTPAASAPAGSPPVLGWITQNAQPLRDDWTLGSQVIQYLRTGEGDLVALIGQMSTAWRSQEIAQVLRWLRDYNASHADQVEFVGSSTTRPGRWRTTPSRTGSPPSHRNGWRRPAATYGRCAPRRPTCASTLSGTRVSRTSNRTSGTQASSTTW